MATVADLLTSKIPPHSLEAERALLGGLMVEPAAVVPMLARLVPQDFYKDGHRKIFAAMISCAAAGQGVDVITVSETLRRADEFDEVGGSAAMALLLEDAGTLYGLDSYAGIVRDKATMRDLIRLGTEIIGKAYENGQPPTDLLAKVTRDLEALTGRTAAPQVAAPFSEGAGDLLARAFQPVEVYIEGILTGEGSGFIGGEEKLGKTYYALVEAFSLALGIPLCGRFAVPERRRVLFIEEEDSPRRTRLRLRAIARGAGADPDGPAFQEQLSEYLRTAIWTGFRLDDETWLARLDAELRAFPAAVVYLDVLRKLTVKDLSKQPEAAVIFDALDQARRRHGCLFRVLHHYRKGQGMRMGRGSQELGGSFVLGAWAEQSVFLEPVGRKGGGTSFDVQLKDAAAPTTLRLRFEAEGPAHEPHAIRLHLEDVKPDLAPGEKHADQILQLLSTLPSEPGPHGAGVTVGALSKASNLSAATVLRALRFLAEKGFCTSNDTRSTKARRYNCT